MNSSNDNIESIKDFKSQLSRAQMIELNGTIIKSNLFETVKGIYHIMILSYSDKLYFLKKLNDKIVECKFLADIKVS